MADWDPLKDMMAQGGLDTDKFMDFRPRRATPPETPLSRINPNQPPGFNPAEATIAEGGTIRSNQPVTQNRAEGGYVREEADLNRINEVLEANRDKNFVQRIMQPKEAPTYRFPQGSTYGDYGTHLMGSAQVGDKNIVFPRLVQQSPGSELTLLGPREAIDYALKNKEFIEFKSPEEAEWFGQNYKKAWGPGW